MDILALSELAFDLKFLLYPSALLRTTFPRQRTVPRLGPSSCITITPSNKAFCDTFFAEVSFYINLIIIYFNGESKSQSVAFFALLGFLLKK